MRIAIILPGNFLSGGIHIALKWAQILSTRHDVFVLSEEMRSDSVLPFLKREEIRFTLGTFADFESITFDLVMVTWWETAFSISRLRTKNIVMLQQAMESQFYAAGAADQAHYRAVVTSGLNLITIAHWLRDFDARCLGVDLTRLRTVLNPLDQSMWKPVAPLIERNPSKIRFLVEGNFNEPRKNALPVIQLLERLGCEYIWVGAKIDPELAGPHCVKTLQRVPYADMPAVYASADVLVKLSNAEGMFGPPLEMFATGGTAVVWDVNGADEYVTHGYNALVVPMNDFAAAEAAVALLLKDTALLAELRTNARTTAQGWLTWDEQAPIILQVVESLPPVDVKAILKRVRRVDNERYRLGIRDTSLLDEFVRRLDPGIKRTIRKLLRRAGRPST